MEGNKRIRVLHVAQAAGGVDRYLQILLKYLDNNMFENIVVCSFDYDPVDYQSLVSSFEQVKMHRAISVRSDLKAVAEVRSLIKKYKPDIVYAHSSKAGAIARIARVGMKNKCIYNPHGWSFKMHCSKSKQLFYTVIERILAPFCDQIVCISEAEKLSALNAHICARKNLQVIFNGVDIQQYESGEHGVLHRCELGIPEDAFVIGTVGRISPQKSPDIFIKATKEIKEKIRNTHFIMVGDGEQRKEIEEYAKRNGIANSLHITGWVNNPMSYVELFNVALLLSRWEGFGLALPEYMMAGKPIVATNVDAIPNIIKDRENGILVNMDDVDGICSAVLEIYDNRKLYEHLVMNGQSTVQRRFNAKRVAEEHGSLFMTLMK